MWAANQFPEEDRANLNRLIDNIGTIKAKHFILISSIAVLDDMSAGYTEVNARYEQNKAYGRHRRELEERLAAQFANCHILRLPALFGPGLKKNFIFDLLNPVPSFIKPDRFAALAGDFTLAEMALLNQFYTFDEHLKMWGLARKQLQAAQERGVLEAAFERIGFIARNFTNSASQFQFYNVQRLGADINRVVNAGLDVVNICSEPQDAAQICYELTGKTFSNNAPPLVNEDMRSIHADVFGGAGPYLFSRAMVMEDLKTFFEAEATA
ncbi:hypothetical protein [Acetobacter sp. LMG 32666]|uniref:hypothetical protein n=1 Tax=Acetobacter sp. LMG 32666 TaxID=2959295 RepID=UPI0030C7A76D